LCAPEKVSYQRQKAQSFNQKVSFTCEKILFAKEKAAKQYLKVQSPKEKVSCSSVEILCATQKKSFWYQPESFTLEKFCSRMRK